MSLARTKCHREETAMGLREVGRRRAPNLNYESEDEPVAPT
jgi:hypothetical protein